MRALATCPLCSRRKANATSSKPTASTQPRAYQAPRRSFRDGVPSLVLHRGRIHASKHDETRPHLWRATEDTVDKLKQYQADMKELGGAIAVASVWLSKAADIILRMGEAVDVSASLDPATPEPAPRPCEEHEPGSCSCDGPVTGPHFPAPKSRAAT